MKYKAFSFFKSVTLLLIVCTALVNITGCTKNFEERNTDPTRVTSLTPNDLLAFITTAEKNSLYTDGYQIAQGLFADQYCQYFAGTQTAFDSHRYVIHQSWVSYQFSTIYGGVMPALVNIINNSKDGKAPTLNAIARIYKVFVLHRTTDYYGPIPYSKIGSDSSVINYDPQDVIYKDFFKELREAAADLKNNITVTVPSFGDKDRIYGGDLNQWLKFCNTLRLRLALRVSKVDPAMAKAEAEAAVADGVLTAAADDAMFKVNADFFNSFGLQSGWNEFRMSATMESVLKGFNDPRMGKYFQPAASGGYHGARNGMKPSEQTEVLNDYTHNSNVNAALTPDFISTTNMSVMRSAEAYFLRSEGALNGWNMDGNAKDLYEQGIKTAMESWGITDAAAVTAYTNGTSTPIALTDFFNTPALTDIPVKWASVEEKQREQIGTQKWLAVYPDGHEAWADMRRSNYPKIYPLINSDNPDVPKTAMISRITFLDAERQRNGPAVKAAEALLGGPDKASTPLWWDK
jgi:Susd and RagB outer membrane lipoprotein